MKDERLDNLMLEFQFMQNALLAGIIIGMLCPCVGLFLVLKRYSMMGDTLSHSSFAGVSIGLVFGFNPLITSFLFTSVCALIIEYLRSYYKRYAELVMSIVLTFSLGVAIVLISTGKASTKVSSYLFGSILTVSKEDLLIIFIISIICFMGILALYNKLIYTTFDEDGAKVCGINIKLINYLFTLMVGATISVSIRIMGILVISSIIVLPVATALSFKKNFKSTLFLSMFLGVFDVLLGLILSYTIDSAPGGTIALSAVFILLISLLINRKKL